MARRAAARPASVVGDVCRAMERIAPPRLAQSWDNVGLLAGDPTTPCTRALLCIDLSAAVVDEAARLGAALIVAYHPPIFRPIRAIRADGRGAEADVCAALRRGLSVYSPHTALDAAEGGTNDVLAGLCGLADVEPFEYLDAAAPECKMVVFVPPGALDRVAGAMFAAGAGRIGRYEQCSYRLRGEGTFFGTDETNPAVGRKGRLERVDEVRLETVVPAARVPEVVRAMIAAHPYETPAYDVYSLRPPGTPGIGRVGALPRATTLGSLARALARRVESSVTQIVGGPGRRVRRVAVCVGAAGLLPLEHAASADADVIVTGEIRHHDALTIRRVGTTAIALGHWESERPVLPSLAVRLREAVPGVDVRVSRADTGPFRRA